MGFFSEIAGEFKKKTKKAVKITPDEKQSFRKAPSKTHRATVRAGSGINMGRAIGTTTRRLKTEKTSFKLKIPKTKKKRRTVRIIHLKGGKVKKKRKLTTSRNYETSFISPF